MAVLELEAETLLTSKEESQWVVVWRRFRKHKLAVAGAVLIVFLITVSLLAPLIAPQDPFDLASFDILDAELPPAWQEGGEERFPLGTDAQGRDLLSAILYGARISLLIGILAVLIQAAIGVTLGLLAGYFGGRVDSIVTRLADIQLALSTLMMAIVAMALVRAGLGGQALSLFAVPLLVIVIGLAEWPGFVRAGSFCPQARYLPLGISRQQLSWHPHQGRGV